MEERQKIRKCFCDFIEKSLISKDIDGVMELFADDVMGIGMGAQGIVRCKEDMRPILLNTRNSQDVAMTTVRYGNMQIRHYGDDYASICSTVTINTEIKGKLQKSHIGQCASLRKTDGVWKINMVQATPLSMDIQEIDAYPLSFAEDEIEKYRMQEQFSLLMQKNMIASYKIDFEEDIYEEYMPMRGYSVPVSRGEQYETKIFRAANDMLDGEIRLLFLQTFSQANLVKCYQSGQEDITLDYESAQPDGKVYWMRSSVHLFTDVKGHLKGYLYVFDIDEQKRQELALEQRAEMDLMTSVYNKETTRKKIDVAIQLYSRPSACAFFMLDIDYFKQINDTYGHAKGDEVIKKTAASLKSIFREEDIIGRVGGDEFCVFYTGSHDPGLLAKKAESICEAVRGILPARNGAPGTTVSVGIARRTGSEDFDELFKKADQALYIRKAQEGRDGYTFFRER